MCNFTDTNNKCDTLKNTNNFNKKLKAKFDIELEAHFKNSFVAIKSQTFYCKDSRGDEANFGASGGDFGEFLLGLDCFVKFSIKNGGYVGFIETNSNLDINRIVDELFEKWLNSNCTKFRPFYLHSDRSALTRLLTEMSKNSRNSNCSSSSNSSSNNNSNSNNAINLRNIKDKADQEKFTELYGTNSEFHGCGHLKLILENPAKYEIDAKIFKALIRSFFLRYFESETTDERLLFKIYEKTPQGKALAIIYGPAEEIEMSLLGTQNPTNGDQLFILNQHAITNYRKTVLIPFFTALNPKIDANEFFKLIDEKAWRNAMYSADSLASGKPIYRIELIYNNELNN